MTALLFAIFAGIAWAFLGLSYKMADERGCRPLPFTVAFMLVAGMVSAVLLPGEATAWSSPWLWLIGSAVGIVTFVNIALLTRTNALGPASITWTMLNLGLLAPILLAPLLFHEALYLVDLILLALFLLMLIAFARSMATGSEMRTGQPGLFTLCVIGIFLLEGLFLLGGKVKFAVFGTGSSAGFTTIFYLVGAALAWIPHRLNRRYSPLRRIEWQVGAFAGVTSSVGCLLFLAAMTLPAIVAFPLTLGISLLGGVLLTVLIYKERLNPLKNAGLGLGFVVLLLATLREPILAWLRH